MKKPPLLNQTPPSECLANSNGFLTEALTALSLHTLNPAFLSGGTRLECPSNIQSDIYRQLSSCCSIFLPPCSMHYSVSVRQTMSLAEISVFLILGYSPSSSSHDIFCPLVLRPLHLDGDIVPSECPSVQADHPTTINRTK